MPVSWDCPQRHISCERKQGQKFSLLPTERASKVYPKDKERKELFQGKKPSLAPLVSPGKRLADHTGGLAWHQNLAGKAFKHECLKITDEDTNYGFAGRLAPIQRGKKKG